MISLLVRGGAHIDGVVTVPGDRSICHRAFVLASLAEGSSSIRNLGTGEDVSSMLRCLTAFGLDVQPAADGVRIVGKGFGGWGRPTGTVDCGNSGATMRQLAGVAARLPFASTFDGDRSLRKRPMERVARPLRELGAHITTSPGGTPPITVTGGELEGRPVEIEVASAQVKSSVLLAALGAAGRTTVVEPRMSRDHSERLLSALDAPIECSVGADGAHVVSISAFEPPPFELEAPGDVSSAAFVVAAGLLCGRSRVNDVGLNPTRTGFIDAVRHMGGGITTAVDEVSKGEPVGWIQAIRSNLSGITISDAGPEIHDELPLLAVLATQADGQTVVRGAAELRVKESDRIAALGEGLRALGANVEDLPDGFVVNGPTSLTGGPVDSAGDHRIALAFAIAGLVARGTTEISGFGAASVSWPGFERTISSMGADLELR